MGVRLNSILPGKPVEHALVESFSGRLLNECLGTIWDISMKPAMEVIGISR